MAGRPPQIYLPLPRCKNGHKRSAKNTIWIRHRFSGKYEYLTARCTHCESEKYFARKLEVRDGA